MNQGDYSHSDLLAEVDRALDEQPRTFRQEIRDLVNAPKGSEEANARRALGWSLILFGIFGVPIVLAVLLLIGWVIWSLIEGVGLLF